jgi:hypothetical protein
MEGRSWIPDGLNRPMEVLMVVSRPVVVAGFRDYYQYNVYT